MAPTLYMAHTSPPVRAVLMTAKRLGLVLNEKQVNIFEGEQLKPEFIKLNPQHTLPTLVDDDGFVVWDSHAIVTYLVGKYGKDDSLYPKDLQKKAVVDQRLHFESGVVFRALADIMREVVRGTKTSLNESDIKQLEDIHGFLEAFLCNNEWIAGDSLTVADFSIFTSVLTLSLLLPIDGKKFPKVSAWFERIKALPEYEVNKKGLELLKEFLKKFNL